MGKKGGGSSGGTQTTKVELPKWVESKSKKTAGFGERLMGNPYQTYGGQRVAQFSPDQRSAMQQTRRQASPGYQFAGRDRVRDSIRDVRAQSVGAERTDTQNWTQAQRSQYMNPYLDAVADTTAADMERARGVQQRDAGDQAASAGAFGGARHGVAEAENNRNFFDRMGATMGNLRHQGYGQAASIFGQDMGRQLQSDTGNANRTLRADMSNADRHLQAQGMNQNADMQSYGLWDTMFDNQVGATQRLGQQGAAQQSQRQRVLDQDYSDWMTLQQAPYERANFLTGILGGTPYGKTTTGPAPQQQGPSAAQSILGAGTTLGAAYLMSDRRVKRDVRRVGTDENTGLGLYAYRYLWSDAPEIGVMADEVRRVRPDAVSTGALTGLDMVDYAKLEVAA